MTKEDATSFLDGMIQARIAIRVLAEHHLALKDEPIPGWIGVVDTKLKPAKLIKSTCDYVQELCHINYGSAPEYEINGHVGK
jgi:hypothetical protein